MLVSANEKQEVKLQIRRVRSSSGGSPNREESEAEDQISSDKIAISRHLFTVLRGTHHLVFANSRRAVETYADILRQMSEETRVPNEFFPHHGSLLPRAAGRLGGATQEIARYRPPPSARPPWSSESTSAEWSLWHRLERRRPSRVLASAWVGPEGGGAAVLRIYMSEPEPNAARSTLNEMRWELVRNDCRHRTAHQEMVRATRPRSTPPVDIGPSDSLPSCRTGRDHGSGRLERALWRRTVQIHQSECLR